MATRSVKEQEIITLPSGRKIPLAQLESMIDKVEGRSPGFYDDLKEDDKWNAGYFTRVLGPGNSIVWKVSLKSGYISCLPNLRFRDNKPIPGFGGDEEQWASYHTYFRGKEYVSDFKTVREVSRKVKAAKTKGRRSRKVKA